MDFFQSLRQSFRWSKTSYMLLSGFLLILFLIGYIWWPLLKEYLSYFNQDEPIWRQMDWLLIGNFLFMSVFIMLNADLKRDIPFFIIGMAGGYIIEAWGTLSGLWTYYTFETPPLWIIPAWPIAALSVNWLFMMVRNLLHPISDKPFKWVYWPIFGGFFIYMMNFIAPSFPHPLTVFAAVLCLILILTSNDPRSDILILGVGSALGYFLERWGTTRLCWVYYTGGTPPLFTVLAHGMASVAVWRFYQIYLSLINAVKADWTQFLIPDEEIN